MMMKSKSISTKIKYADIIFRDERTGVFCLCCSKPMSFEASKAIEPIINKIKINKTAASLFSIKHYTLMEDLQIGEYGYVIAGTKGFAISGDMFYFDMIKQNEYNDGTPGKLAIMLQHILLNDELFAPTEN